MRPLFSVVRQAVGQADSLPGQQAVRAELGEQGGVEDTVGGLSHQQAAPKQVEVIQRHEEAWRSEVDDVVIRDYVSGRYNLRVDLLPAGICTENFHFSSAIPESFHPCSNYL